MLHGTIGSSAHFVSQHIWPPCHLWLHGTLGGLMDALVSHPNKTHGNIGLTANLDPIVTSVFKANWAPLHNTLGICTDLVGTSVSEANLAPQHLGHLHWLVPSHLTHHFLFKSSLVPDSRVFGAILGHSHDKRHAQHQTCRT